MTELSENMNIRELVQDYPDALDVFGAYGIGCIGCAMARYETIKQGLEAHGIPVEQFMADLKKAVNKE